MTKRGTNFLLTVIITTLFLALNRAECLAGSDAEFERAGGLDKALSANPKTITSDGGLEGKTFTLNNACGKAGCKATFNFKTAKNGTYPYAAARGKLVKGVYTRIDIKFDPVGCGLNCKEVRALQVLRVTSLDAAGNKTTADPTSPTRRKKAGWGVANSPSRGWYVDSANNAPFYGPGAAKGSANIGSNTTPLVFRDAPGFWATTTSKGKEFVLCAVCYNPPTGGTGASLKDEMTRHKQKLAEILGDGSTSIGTFRAWESEEALHEKKLNQIIGFTKIIGCIRWGFTIDAFGNAAFDPKPPVIYPKPPQEVVDATKRFEGLPGNRMSNIRF